MLLLCQACQAKVGAKEVASVKYLAPDGSRAVARLFACPSCTQPMLARQYVDIEREDEDGRKFTFYTPAERIYPAARTVDENIPETIRKSIEEARRCLDHRCYVASAIMCRRTLEALCKHHGTKGKNLAASLKELHDAKVIDDRLYEWAEALRADGNLAAHVPEATFSRQDAEDLAEFSEAILEYVFVLSDRFAAFKARRAKAQAAAGPNPPQVKSVNGGAAE